MDKEYEGITISYSDYIKRIYFDEPIVCSNMNFVVLEYENTPALRINFYKETNHLSEAVEYEMIELYDHMIQNSLENNYIEYNFDNMYNVEKLEFDININTDIIIEYNNNKTNKYETKILKSNNTNIFKSILSLNNNNYWKNMNYSQ
jgi:hypothetical protein